MTKGQAHWRLAGLAYEFCNCNPGCSCNFTGYPTSPDGSCKTAIGMRVQRGFLGDLDLAGLETVFIVDWPGPIHEGGGKAVLCFSPGVEDQKVDAFVDILSGRMGGMPWSVASTTFTITDVMRVPVEIDDQGINSRLRIEGVGEAAGTALTHPATGNDNRVAIVLEHGFIFNRGDCGKGDFRIDLHSMRFDFTGTNWILFDFDWSSTS
jgi:hypothetical protein